MPISWSKAKRWSCVRCGKCCIDYIVPLTYREAFRLQSVYGVRIYKLGDRYVLKGAGEPCPFLILRPYSSICTIQNEKPRACKLYPFIIRLKPIDNASKEYAEFTYKGNKYYVYLQSGCRGIGQGADLELVIPKFIELWLSWRR